MSEVQLPPVSAPHVEVAAHPSALGLRAFLRTETEQAHRETEAFWLPQGGVTDGAAYTAFLAQLLHVHTALGLPAAKARRQQGEIDAEQTRIAALCADTGQPLSLPPTKVPDGAYAWGVGYVLNGSTLGAS